MLIIRTFALFLLSGVAELFGSWLVWQGIRENRGLLWVGLGIIASGVYPLSATLQAEPEFGRILAAYGGVFIVVALGWSAILDGFRPDRFDVIGASICIVGVTIIMFGPRGA